MPVRICLLGPVAVLGEDGQPVDVGGPRARALLARLAVEPGRVVGLDTLIEAVWDADPPAAPGNAVQALVSRLRRALPAVPLRAQAHGYLLDLPADAVDAGRFEALVARAREDRDPDRALALLREAEQLWRGPALADLRDLAFTGPLAARWDELRLTAAEQRLGGELERGRAAAALAELEELVAAHPLREPLCLLQVRALARLGRSAEALAAYERCRDRLADELGMDPSAALQAEHLAVLRGGASAPPRDGGPLRTPLTSFRGRDGELEAVAGLLDGGRLVTLLGPGGAGKTRLALEAAHRRRADVPDGVWWVELAPVADARLLPAAVLSAVGQREGTSLERVPTLVEASARLQETFADRRALLVLDNCEHLVAAVAAFTDDLLGHCPRLQVLTTSREPLGIPGEAVLPVGPLEVPAADDEAAAGSPVVQLFADRAAAVRPDFAVTPATLPAVLEVCRRLDGMPLALELAAARLRTLGIGQIAARLDDRFSLLTGGSRVALPRHQTLRAVVEWSWEALDEREQEVARRLSVFAGGATLDTAEQVCGDPGWGTGAVLDAITGLVEKSMLLAVAEDGQDGGVRYRMLETIRAYAGEQLTAAGERSRVEAAQTAWCLQLVDELDPQLRGTGQLAALQRMHAEHDGLLAVLQRCVAAGDGEAAVHLGARLSWYWLLTGRQVAAGRWLTEVISVPGGSPALRAMCEAFSAMGRAEGGDWQSAVPALRAIGDLPPERTYRSTEPLGALAWAIAMVFSGDFRSLEALLLLEGHPDRWVVAAARAIRAQLAENLGELHGMAEDLREAHAEFVRLGDRWGRSFTAAALGGLSSVDGDAAGAIGWLTEAVELSEELGTTDDTPMMRIRLAMAYALAGDLVRADAEVAQVLAELSRDGGLHLAGAEAAAGAFALLAGRLDDAERWHRLALEHVRATSGGPPQIEAMVLAGTTGVLAARAEREPAAASDLITEAYRLLEPALRLAVEGAGDMPVAANVVLARAAVVGVDGDHEQAARLLGMATAVRGRRDLGDLGARVTEQRLRAALGDPEFDRLRAAGEAVPRDEVLAGLGVDPTGGWRPVPVPADGGQTRRR
ncbi:putative ATPase/DNA-binding SARP family transcriptional activator [Modestobacter versicolor]|uniref:Putative ATPase/DNA-binding SARP family transcriptional activator n=3 Tax=Modestobacter versicolor TaxID=429133 RepID=A0A839Y1M3_9ACTN|nr:putative ATPase/DNA-binding SARP family transcriptional activator [Modestobacter versicolor]